MALQHIAAASPGTSAASPAERLAALAPQAAVPVSAAQGLQPQVAVVPGLQQPAAVQAALPIRQAEVMHFAVLTALPQSSVPSAFQSLPDSEKRRCHWTTPVRLLRQAVQRARVPAQPPCQRPRLRYQSLLTALVPNPY